MSCALHSRALLDCPSIDVEDYCCTDSRLLVTLGVWSKDRDAISCHIFCF